MYPLEHSEADNRVLREKSKPRLQGRQLRRFKALPRRLFNGEGARRISVGGGVHARDTRGRKAKRCQSKQSHMYLYIVAVRFETLSPELESKKIEKKRKKKSEEKNEKNKKKEKAKSIVHMIVSADIRWAFRPLAAKANPQPCPRTCSHHTTLPLHLALQRSVCALSHKKKAGTTCCA